MMNLASVLPRDRILIRSQTSHLNAKASSYIGFTNDQK